MWRIYLLSTYKGTIFAYQINAAYMTGTADQVARTMTISDYCKNWKVNQRYLRRIITADKKQLLNVSYGIISYELLGKTYILTVTRAYPGGTKKEITTVEPNKKQTAKKVAAFKSIDRAVIYKNYMIRFDSREIAKNYIKFFPVKIRKSESAEQFLLTDNPTKSEWELYQVIIEFLRKKKINIEVREW